jgi:ABC-2 type transport system ATP-binding protein
LIELLEGLRWPESGTATVLGVDVPKHLDLIRDRIGIAMQKMALPSLLTVHEVLRLYAGVYPRSEHPDQLIAWVGLEGKRRTRIHHLSGGQLQRLTLALALVGHPQILFLDEPTSELDPQGRRAVWDILLDPQRRKDRTVVLATHQMEEAQQLCDRVAILDHGHILAMGSPAELIHQYCPGQVIRFTTQPHADFQECFGFGSVERQALSRTRDTVTVRTEALEPAMEVLMAARLEGQYSVEDLRVERMTLEDVFLNVTGRRMRD